MATIKEHEKEVDCGFTLVQSKNMRRGKPQQQLYRPGSGPLRKSHIYEEPEPQNLNSRQNPPRSDTTKTADVTQFKSEDVNKTAPHSGELFANRDSSKRTKKPEQMLYVPRPLAQARDVNTPPQEPTNKNGNRNNYFNGNGNEKTPESKDNYHRHKSYTERRKTVEYDAPGKWRDHSPGGKYRQGSEPRAVNGPGPAWSRTRDTRSVEPSAYPNRNYNEKVQSKPPSGRRHSMVGLDERRQKVMLNIHHLPPRLKKKYLEENNLTEENWDGNTMTFQGHNSYSAPKNPGYHPGGNYETLPNSPPYVGTSSMGYYTMPNRGKGRGRFTPDPVVETPPGPPRNRTPERPQPLRTPTNSRPPTPPIVKGGNSRNHSPEDRKYPSRNNEERQWDNKDYDNQRRFSNFHRHDDKIKSGGRDRRDTFGKNDKRDRDVPNRDNRRGKGNFRNKKDRRDGGGRRSRSREYGVRGNGGGSSNMKNEEEKIVEQDKSNTLNINAEIETFHPSRVEETPTSHIEEIVPEHSILHNFSTTLDWSEEVELNDRLESEILSDAPTRSSSITSLHEISTKSLPPNINNPVQHDATKKPRRKHRKGSGNRSGNREGSRSRTRNNRTRQNSTASQESRDGFKQPHEPYFGRRRRSRDRRDSSNDRFRNSSRDPSWDKQKSKQTENWRDEMRRGGPSAEREVHANVVDIKNVDVNVKKAGVIVLPPQKPEAAHVGTSQKNKDQPRCPETRRLPGNQKSLFDPNNPTKPIVVKSPGARVSVPGFSDSAESSPPQITTIDAFGNPRPTWYDENTTEFQTSHHQDLLRNIKWADMELQFIINGGLLLVNWGLVEQYRKFLKEAQEYLLCRSIKFSQIENVEHHFWKILYYNIIEVTRKALKSDPKNKENYKGFLIYLIDEGSRYYERLLGLLEETYNFKVSDFLGENNMIVHKSLGLVGLALISTQKLFLCLGDLGRYREEVNETSNYGKCRQWYIKSYEINPKNGKPYNQLALLAVYAKRKLDAVYYYMRSLMSSNPVPSAKENLTTLFDENRKKFEQGEKKRREERLERQRLQMKQKESEETSNVKGSLRKETWIHPEGGRRVHRTTQASLEQNDSEEEDLASLSSVEVNKRFVISYLHMHGKLITNIGMESFQETAMQMLREFRALLQQSPVPLPCNRFLQLLALNMFAIENTQLKDPKFQSHSSYRSELQERALVVSLQMFDLILERCISILQDHLAAHKDQPVDFAPPDGEVLLPAIKVWCDWMLCHKDIWNPPPSTRDFRVAVTPGDAWSRLAILMNLLEQMDRSTSEIFSKVQKEGFEQIRLPEDCVLNGFTPLMYAPQEAIYAPKDVDTEKAQFSLRLDKLLFFGTVYLCGIEPPVLKLEIEDDFREYVSVVSSANSRDSPPSPQELIRNNDILLESFSSEDEVEKKNEDISNDASSEVKDLLNRRMELEKRKKSQELHMQRVKKILSQSVVSVHIEVRPKYLVPDTNCFIDHLEGIRTIAQSHFYTIMVPIVVLSELEGLSRGGKSPTPDSRSFVDPQHIIKVAGSAREALEFLKTRHASVKCVTTKGAIIPSTTFSTEDDATWDSSLKNDDKILTTSLVLCKGHKEQTHEPTEDEPRELVREVVLLTEDRNLRVKAYARDVPVRELPDFMRWAGLG